MSELELEDGETLIEKDDHSAVTVATDRDMALLRVYIKVEEAWRRADGIYIILSSAGIDRLLRATGRFSE